MRASDIIIRSDVCKQAARNIYPQDPDELFNICWLALREREIKNPGWQPNSPKHYFIWLLKKRATSLLSANKEIPVPDPPEQHCQKDTPWTYMEFFEEWISTTSHNEDIQFLKDILILALKSKNINDACDNAEISRTTFYECRKLAEKKLYDDYHAANIDDFYGDLMA